MLAAVVHYVTGSLVNDQATLLQHIIDDLLGADMIPVMTNYIEIVCIFHYDSHSLQQPDEVGTHGINYGLSKPDLSMPAVQ